MQDWQRTPGDGRYAHRERERRFLVLGLPTIVDPPRLIEDRYITGTDLRLRRVTVDGERVHKLTQKVRVSLGDPYEVAITNMYLTADEYQRLLVLPAAALTKTRHIIDVEQVRFAVDQFHDKLQGLCLAETEADTRDAQLPRPDWLGEEVTADDRYSGGELAQATDAEARRLSAV